MSEITDEEPVQVRMEVRIRRTFLISAAATIAEWFYPVCVPQDSIPDKLLGLGCRIAKPEFRFDDGPWQPMGKLSHQFRNRGYHTEVEIHVHSPEEK